MSDDDLRALSAICPPAVFPEWVRIMKTMGKLDALLIDLSLGTYNADDIVKALEAAQA